MSTQIADVVASCLVSMIGSGLLGNYLLQRHRAQHETQLARLRNDLETRIRTLQASLDRTLLVHRVQFETEFAAMKLIWERVISVRGLMAGLRPISSRGPEDDTPEQSDRRFADLVARFSAALGELKDSLFKSSPFIAKDLYAELFDQLLLAAQAEETSVSIHRRGEDKWYETGQRNLSIFMESAERVSELIRKRIETLAVIPE